jgi:hypothetical protein
VAITDPGSPLVSHAGEMGFRRIFLNPPDIGGRYSALSYFGLLPAALMGIDIRALLERAAQLLPRIETDNSNDAIRLGAALGELGLRGRDKITFVLSPAIAAFGCWVEQLLAESTGKQGQGVLPVDGEPLGRPASYGRDRIFVHLRLRSSSDAEAARRLSILQKAGHPVIRLELSDPLDLGREFFRWEIATAVAAAVGKTDAFDEPNVKESKNNTERLLKQFSSARKPPAKTPLLRESGIALYGKALPTAIASAPGSSTRRRSIGIQECLAAHFRRAAAGDYIAILAYLAPTPATDQLLQRVRLRLRDALAVATTVGYGPRYLHSTGQFHKGGPAKGVFLQITTRDRSRLRIPELPYGFSLLKQAQAEGDFEALQARNKPILRLHLQSAEAGLRQLVRWVENAFPPPHLRLKQR